MRKVFMILLMALFMSASAFAIGGSVTSTTVYDADAETIAETLATSFSVGPLTIDNKFVLSDSVAADVEELDSSISIDWEGAIDYALSEAITLGISSSYGIDSEDIVILNAYGSWTLTDFLSMSAKYTNPDLNAEEVGIGSFTLGVSITF